MIVELVAIVVNIPPFRKQPGSDDLPCAPLKFKRWISQLCRLARRNDASGASHSDITLSSNTILEWKRVERGKGGGVG